MRRRIPRGDSPIWCQARVPLQRLAVLALVGAIVVAAAASCGRRPRSPGVGQARETLGDTIRNTDDAQIYAAALRTVVERSAYQRFMVRDSAVRILESLRWWPMADHPGWQGERLGPVPWTLLAEDKRVGHEIRIVRWRDAVDSRGALRPGSPLLMLGPIDYMAPDQASLRVNRYLGPQGQTLYRLLIRLVAGEWRVDQFVIEMNT